MGLPPTMRRPDANATRAPQWLQNARATFVMRARIVDFYHHAQSINNLVRSYLEFLGFTVSMDHSATQIGVSCGHVCARNMCLLHLAGPAFGEVDLHDSVDGKWITEGNAKLVPGATNLLETLEAQGPCANAERYEAARKRERLTDYPDNSLFTSMSEVQLMARHWLACEREHQQLPRCRVEECPSCRDNTCIQSITSLDYTLQHIAQDVQSMHQHGTMEPSSPQLVNCQHAPLRLRVSNTCRANETGAHWFSIAYSIERRV